MVTQLGSETHVLHLDPSSFHYDGKATDDGELNYIRIANGSTLNVLKYSFAII